MNKLKSDNPCNLRLCLMYCTIILAMSDREPTRWQYNRTRKDLWDEDICDYAAIFWVLSRSLCKNS